MLQYWWIFREGIGLGAGGPPGLCWNHPCLNNAKSGFKLNSDHSTMFNKMKNLKKGKKRKEKLLF